MLGYRAAADLGKHVGDSITIEDSTYTVTGIFSTGQVFGDTASMLPLTTLQAEERKPGTVTLLFVRIKPGSTSTASAIRSRPICRSWRRCEPSPTSVGSTAT